MTKTFQTLWEVLVFDTFRNEVFYGIVCILPGEWPLDAAVKKWGPRGLPIRARLAPA